LIILILKLIILGQARQSESGSFTKPKAKLELKRFSDTHTDTKSDSHSKLKAKFN